MVTIKTCSSCRIQKDIGEFGKQKGRNGKTYFRNKCNKCKNRHDYIKMRTSPEKYKKKRKANAARRQNPKNRAKFILSNSKLYDSKHKLENNLDELYIKSLIQNGCSYCGNDKYKVGLDRIDNKMGHIKDNVIAACTRCNFIRRDMPYEAWKLLVPTIREIVERDLFEDWTCGFEHHKIKKRSN
jgi:hypothetical protein